MKKFVLFLAVGAAMTACGSKSAWNAEAEKKYMDDCQKGSAEMQAMCQCQLDVLKKENVSPDKAASPSMAVGLKMAACALSGGLNTMVNTINNALDTISHMGHDTTAHTTTTTTGGH